MAATPQCSPKNAVTAISFLQSASPATPAPPLTPLSYPSIHCTKEVPFEPVVEWSQDSTSTRSYYQSIIYQEPYTNATFEELRYVDYFNDLRFGGARSLNMEGRSDRDVRDPMAELASYVGILGTMAQRSTAGYGEEVKTTPLFRWPVHLSDPEMSTIATTADKGHTAERTTVVTRFEQYAILGSEATRHDLSAEDRAIFLNTNAPWSAFLCGSQGSGKSYTLSCILECCLLKSPRIGKTPRPMAGIVFAYDAHSSGIACEAACLASDLPVNVLVSPSNYREMKKLYEKLPGTRNRIAVHPLFLDEQNLNTQRMLKLMAFSGSDGPVPLYMEVIMNILKEMAMDRPADATGFDLNKFLLNVKLQRFDLGQKGPMQLRLNLLDAFMNSGSLAKKFSDKSKLGNKTLFKATAGSLTIVDLTDPFVDPASACVLFDICLALFLEDRSGVGKVVALDEAHKFMAEGTGSEAFTQSLLTVIREQRHKGARVVIATQEPTISPKLLDLCSMTFVHRFTSPDWLAMLQKHLAGASKYISDPDTKGKDAQELFDEIINLNVGESLLFSPSAMMEVIEGVPQKLGANHIRFKTRMRLTADGGRSITAT